MARNMTARHPRLGREQGVALPVMLIILAVMLVGSIYLLKNTHSTTLTTGNLAYDATLSKQADLGLHQAFAWLRSTSAAGKAGLNNSNPDNAYVAHLNTAQTPRDPAQTGFWAGGKTITVDAGTQIEYVIHRLCSIDGAYDNSSNHCVQTAENKSALGNRLPFGQSAASDAADYTSSPMLHYVITARISGARGASVTNQMIVQIGA